jgi:hypothetical protein
MMPQWVRLVSLILVAGLLTGSQCHAVCLASMHNRATGSANDCHHDQRQGHDLPQDCHDHNGTLSSPERSADVQVVAHFITSDFVVSDHGKQILTTAALSPFPEVYIDSLPRHTGTSVFAILSTFRI